MLEWARRACAGVVLARAIIRDVYDRDAAAARHRDRHDGDDVGASGVAGARCLSRRMGALACDFRGLLGGAGAAVLALTVIRLRETNPAPVPLDLSGMARTCAMLLRSPQFLCLALCSACTSASWFTFCASAPHLLAQVMDPGQAEHLMG